MPNLRFRLLLVSATLAATGLAARAEEQVTTLPFSKPDQPGTVKIILAHGGLRVESADVKDVTVKSEAKAVTPVKRKDGLRVITSSSSFALSEKENTITLDAMSEGWAGSPSDFRLTVPRTTSVVVQSGWGGDIQCTNIGGDIEIKNTNGEIRLDGVRSGVTVETMNGEISANIVEIRDGKPLSFASMNGEVVLRVQPEAKASVRLRTQNGSVLTDFDDKVLVTKTENTARSSSGRTRKVVTVLPPEARRAIAESVRAAAQVGREIAEATREGIEEARGRAEANRALAELQRSQAELDAKRAAVAGNVAPPAPPAAPEASVPALAPMPPLPAIPTLTGGKLVTGTLNGGGPEISVSTMNGDVTLRQLEKK